MFRKLKSMRLIAAASPEQSRSLKRRLGIYWLSMATAGMAALLLILSFTGVFSSSSRRLESFLQLQQQNSLMSLQSHMDSLEAGCISLSSGLSDKIDDVLISRGMGPEELNNNPELINELEEAFYPLLNAGLRSLKCSGIFVCLDASCNTSAPEAENSRMGVYLRYSDLSGVNTANKHIAYFRGALEPARQEKISMHNRWNPELDISYFPRFNELMGSRVERLAEHCLWTEKLELKDTWERAVLLYVPVLGNDSRVLGICGIELSELYFHLSYPASEGPFGTVLTAAAPVEGSTVYLEGAMKGGSRGRALPELGALTVKEGRFYSCYSSGAEEFLGLHELLPARLDSGRRLALISLVPESSFSTVKRNEKLIWTACLLAVIAAMLIISRLITRRLVGPVSMLLKAVKAQDSIEGRSTGISEIDELVDCLQDRARSSSGALPPKIEALLDNFALKVATLTPMERTVLQLYIEGFSIEESAARSFISVNTAKKHNTHINQKLGVKSREELMLYIDLFRRCGKLDMISYKN